MNKNALDYLIDEVGSERVAKMIWEDGQAQQHKDDYKHGFITRRECCNKIVDDIVQFAGCASIEALKSIFDAIDIVPSYVLE